MPTQPQQKIDQHNRGDEHEQKRPNLEKHRGRFKDLKGVFAEKPYDQAAHNHQEQIEQLLDYSTAAYFRQHQVIHNFSFRLLLHFNHYKPSCKEQA
jgi:hypothetical protein